MRKFVITEVFICFLYSRAQGVAVGQDLVDHGWIESLPATEEDVFKDEYMLYQPGKVCAFNHPNNFVLFFVLKKCHSNSKNVLYRCSVVVF